MRIVTIGSAGSHGGYSYKCAKAYETGKTKDGTWVWKKLPNQGPDRRGRGVLEQDARELADEVKADLMDLEKSRMNNQPLTPEEILMMKGVKGADKSAVANV